MANINVKSGTVSLPDQQVSPGDEFTVSMKVNNRETVASLFGGCSTTGPLGNPVEGHVASVGIEVTGPGDVVFQGQTFSNGVDYTKGTICAPLDGSAAADPTVEFGPFKLQSGGDYRFEFIVEPNNGPIDTETKTVTVESQDGGGGTDDGGGLNLSSFNASGREGAIDYNFAVENTGTSDAVGEIEITITDLTADEMVGSTIKTVSVSPGVTLRRSGVFDLSLPSERQFEVCARLI